MGSFEWFHFSVMAAVVQQHKEMEKRKERELKEKKKVRSDSFLVK